MDISVSDAPVGRLLDGRYRIEAMLARGGMATVYKATDIRLGRQVALKVMHAELAADDEFVARFIREARSVAQLSDPHVVNVFDQGEDDGAVFLAMEYIEGRTLRDVLYERGRLGASLALDVAESVLSALTAAHRSGIVHRDVKPENVLVGNDGRVKVADFGLARAVSSSSKTTRGLLGTVNYISPEQALGEKATPRSDVYSTGIMLYELLTGRAPHDGPTDFVVVRCHIDEDVPPPSSSVPLPPVVDELVLTATGRQPVARYADAGEFLAAVRSARANLSGTAPSVPDGFGGSDMRGVSAESRDLAGFSMHDALAETVLAGRLFDDDDTTSDTDDDTAGAAAAEPENTDQADATDTADGAVRPVDHPVDQSVDQAAKHGPPPPPPPHGSRTRVIAGQDESSTERHTGWAGFSWTDEPEDEGSTTRRSDRRPERRGRRGLIMFLLVLLLVVAVAVGAWWYGAGRWGSTPSLLNLSPERAEAAATEAGFTAEQGGSEYSETVEAGLVLSTDPGPNERILDGGEITYVVSKGPERYEVPQLRDMTVDQANQALADTSVTVNVDEERHDPEIAEGHIVSQDVEAGEQVRPDTEVNVVVSLGPKPIDIEDFTGRSADEAEAALSEAGLEVSTSEEFSDTVPTGSVISQEPATGTVYSGDEVSLVVSRGPENVTVPNVVGQKVKEAERTLKDRGFEVNTVDLFDGPGGGGDPRVVRVDPSGSNQPYGSTLTLYHF